MLTFRSSSPALRLVGVAGWLAFVTVRLATSGDVEFAEDDPDSRVAATFGPSGLGSYLS